MAEFQPAPQAAAEHDVIVVGGGIIGLTCAWALAREGRVVTLLDPAASRDRHLTASWVAGGMLAPSSEGWHGEDKQLALGTASLRAWPEFAERLRAGGAEFDLNSAGTVCVGVDSADVEELARVADYLRRQDRAVEWLGSRQLRSQLPGVGPAVRKALMISGDYSVDNRQLLTALRRVCEASGVHRQEGEVATLAQGSVQLVDGSTLQARQIVLAAGVWSAGLDARLRGWLRPVKGEILRLRPGPGAPAFGARTVRAVVGGRASYLVPRPDGEVVLGASSYEADVGDTAPRAGGVLRLLRDAEAVFPGIYEYDLHEVNAGMRPASADNLPLLARMDETTVVATGHGRNGVLLAPITARTVADLVAGREPVPEAQAAGADRLVTSAAGER